MYQIDVRVKVLGDRVFVTATMWEILDGGTVDSLGDVPRQIYLGASRGHDWYGDAMETLRKWAEMSLF